MEKSTPFSYLVLGAGKQGLAAAYDLLIYGNAARVTLADRSLPLAKAGVKTLQTIFRGAGEKPKGALSAAAADGQKAGGLKKIIQGHTAVLSALPYYLNPAAAAAAIAAKVHYADLGGHFETTQKIMALDKKAKKAGVALIPDCGVSPGMCNSLAACAMEQLNEVTDVRMFCGGLPQHPKPPLGYKIVFNLEGVIGNYFGKAYVLKDGEIALVPSFSDKEVIDFGPPLGRLEAFVTGGATSTCPWTYKGRIRNYDYKTLRYPGHHEKVQALKDLGLLETKPVRINGHSVAPLSLFVAAAGPRLNFPDDRDLLVMRVRVRGKKDGRALEITYDVLEYQDPKTGFTAMQRTTGFSAAVVLEMLAKGVITKTGVAPVEKSVPGSEFVREICRRGIAIKETLRALESQ